MSGLFYDDNVADISIKQITVIPIKLLCYSGNNNSGVDMWIQIFPSTAAPTTGVTLPLTSYLVRAGEPYSISYSPGRTLSPGLYIGWSTTQAVYTVAPGNIGTLFVEGYI